MIRTMNRTFILSLFFFFYSFTSFAWGPEGHAIVGRIALHYLTPDARQNVLDILNGMPIDSAANWMDKIKSNPEYDFMRPWHYLDAPKGEAYTEKFGDNLVNRLRLTYEELEHKNIYCSDQVKLDLLIMLHLVGDLSMPLHAGYKEDFGGNTIMVQYDTLKNHNLHRFWDEDIIDIMHITDSGCIALAKENALSYIPVDFVAWLKESRALLPDVYDYPGFILTDSYMKKNAKNVEMQLLKAGQRLATILNILFASPAPVLDYKSLIQKHKNGILVENASSAIGKEVTVVGRVTNVRPTTATTQIMLKGADPEKYILIVVFERNYDKFSMPLSELFRNKNVEVKGFVKDYNGNPEIILDNQEMVIFIAKSPD